MSGGESVGGLACALRVRRGAFVLDVVATAAPGEVLAVIGANGSGKSTFLGAIAGTHPLERGTVTIGSRVLCSREPSGPPVSLRRAARRVGFLDQRARLFPHLSARANIAFGPRAQGGDRRSADAAADDWLARVGLAGRGDDRPQQLSGGQQQRVAIARTLAAAPELLLLDEPVAALDVASGADLREIIAAEARRLGIPVVLVSHDPLDLVALADTVMVLENGRVAQRGPVAEVLRTPATPFAAAFTGRLIITGTSSGTGLRVPGAPLSTLAGRGTVPPAGATVVATIDPTLVRVTPAHADGAASPAAENGWLGTIGTVSAGQSGIRIECAEWPGMYAELPLTHAFAAWVTAGTHTYWDLPAESVQFGASPTE